MQSIKSLFLFGILSSLALAAPAPTKTSATKTSKLLLRQANGAICGNNDYSSSDISAAQNQGCGYEENGQTVGSNDYPHQYNDYEGFDFSVPSPWYEFPILSSGNVYTGGSPGPDRVIFNDDCELAGVLTHTGASGNDFNECEYE